VRIHCHERHVGVVAVSDPAPAGLRLLDALPPHRRRDSHTGIRRLKPKHWRDTHGHKTATKSWSKRGCVVE